MEQQEQQRDTWTRKLDFLLACVGFAIGLGNVWRFPYLCYSNGGGAFLIPYFISVFVVGIPIFFLEVSLGQFMSQGGIKAWMICPLFQGVGYASVGIIFLLNCYYNVVLAWALYYLFASFTTVLPWTNCNNEWNSDQCMYNVIAPNSTNSTELANFTLKKVDPVAEFWEYKVLDISDGIGNMGSIKWDLALCLLLAWIIVFLCIWKGIRSSGKVMYVTATSPYIFMAILLVRAATLPGAIEGIKVFLIPDWSKLKEYKVWVDAGTQIYFSYAICLGTLTGLGSYNKYKYNSFKDCIAIAAINSFTSIFGGCVIFMTLGFMAQQQGVKVSEVAETGPGLAFIAYPMAVSQMPASPVWSVMFFVMVLLIGLDSQFVGVEGFITAISDMFQKHLLTRRRKVGLVAAVCTINFLIGLSMVTRGGMYVFQLFDYYSGSRIVLIIGILQCLVIAFVYGADRYYKNVHSMYGFYIPRIFVWLWRIGAPLYSLVIFILSTMTYTNLTYIRGTTNHIYEYPRWAVAVGWTMACSSISLVPIVMIYKLFIGKGPLLYRINVLTTPVLKPHQLLPRITLPNDDTTGVTMQTTSLTFIVE